MNRNPLRSSHHKTIDAARDSLDTTDIINHAQNLHDALTRALDHPSTIDGYRNKTLGADPARDHGQAQTIIDEDGHEVAVQLTPVEMLADRPDPKDEYDRLVTDAIAYFDEADRNLRASVNKIKQLNQLRSDSDIATADPGCWALERIGAWEPVFRRAEIDGEFRPLSRWAYDFLRSTDRLPTIDECKRHLRGQRIRRPA